MTSQHSLGNEIGNFHAYFFEVNLETCILSLRFRVGTNTTNTTFGLERPNQKHTHQAKMNMFKFGSQ